MEPRELQAQVEAFVREDLKPFFDALAERASLSDDEYWQRMQAGLNEGPSLPPELLSVVGQDFMSRERVLERRRESDAHMSAASESLVATKVKRCLPYVEAIRGGAPGPLTREDYERAALEASVAEARNVRDRLKVEATMATDEGRAAKLNSLSNNADADVAALEALRASEPLTADALRDVTEEITDRLARITEELREGRLKKPDEHS